MLFVGAPRIRGRKSVRGCCRAGMNGLYMASLYVEVRKIPQFTA
jgi:hypothetical protein